MFANKNNRKISPPSDRKSSTSSGFETKMRKTDFGPIKVSS